MVFEKIREILCDQLDLNEDDVTMSSNLLDDLGADSLDMVDLVMTIEDEFELDVEDEDVENIKTVGDIVHYIEEYK
ncbi:MAG: acyl carrier protein [Clostridia bacterium]|nr:acyl carrier protein [Clostridia bacterium]MBQ2000608.1 acyl carrier protein [Clostridia bacterium]MBQ2318664.1 acyl carrier protein [Clostridia bacterium]MBQ5596938.1 acyl carrier protein [Clostridia bacterium]